jgi:ketosteroid isomerase-like protein
MVALDSLWSAASDVVVFEQGGVDSSWAAYRDGHLGPELVALDSLDFRHRDVQVRTGDRLAVATGRYELTARHDGDPVESQGVFTTVFEEGGYGWRIVHTHLSRPRR